MKKFSKKCTERTEIWIDESTFWWSGNRWYNSDVLSYRLTKKFDLRNGLSSMAWIPQSELASCLQNLKICMIKQGHSRPIQFEVMTYKRRLGKLKRFSRGNAKTIGIHQKDDAFNYRWID
jgi:hypothetical protein